MDEISKSLMLKGQKCCLDKDFPKALEHFDAVIQRTKPGRRAPIEALDRRASVYVQLRRFSEAFQDGKRMIREHKNDARGYLRTAVVLKYQAVEKGDDEYIQSALKVVRSGMKQADKTNAVLHKNLSRMFDELTKMAESSGIDPAERLPLELFAKVMESLDRRSRLGARRISKRWNALVSGTHGLWNTLALNANAVRRTNRLNTRGIDFAIRLATDSQRTCHLTEFSLLNFTHGRDTDVRDVQILSSVLKRASRLRVLRIHGWQWPSQSASSGRIDLSKFDLPDLKVLDVSFCANENKRNPSAFLGEVGGPDSVLDWINHALRNLPQLEHLTVESVHDEQDDELYESVTWPSSLRLKSLHLLHRFRNGLRRTHEEVFDHIPWHYSLSQLAECAPNLEDIVIMPNKSAHDELEHSQLDPFIFTKFSKLKRLDLSGDIRFNANAATLPPGLLVPIVTSPSLEVLSTSVPDVMREPQWPDYVQTVEMLDAPLAPKLQSLDLRIDLNLKSYLPILRRLGCKLRKLDIHLERAIYRGPAETMFPQECLAVFIELGLIGELTELGVYVRRGHSMLDNTFATFVAESFPGLKDLSLGPETSLTGVGMHKLATSLHNLRTLEVGKSPMANVDMIPFFRDRGIQLTGTIGQQQRRAGQGRTVRYE